jgi:hypothetical protein
VSDTQWGKRSNSDHRVFANADGTFRVEDEVALDASASAAASDYVALRLAVRKAFSSLSSQSSPCCLGSQDEEYVGRDSSGRSVIAICWQDGDVIQALLVTTSGAADGYLAESVATAQDLKISSAGL